MIKHLTKAKIFRAAGRSIMNSSQHRQITIVSEEEESSFGSLRFFKEITLAGGEKINLHTAEHCIHVVIPLVGSIQYTEPSGKRHLVEAQKFLAMPLERNAEIQIANSYADDAISFLHLLLDKNEYEPGMATIQNIPLQHSRNQLLPLTISHHTFGMTGLFDGRRQADFNVSVSQGAFAFVVHGAFEINDRLIESGDGLALWNTDQIELEALSEQALILFILADLG